MALAAVLGSDAREVLKIKTASENFLVLGLTGFEHLGQPFEYVVELVGGLEGGLAGMAAAATGKGPKAVDLHSLIGTKACVTMDVADDARYFNGYITSLKRGKRRGRFISYVAELRPWLWFATKAKDNRVFQDKSVKDIVTKVLEPYGTDSEWRLDKESVYPTLDYCVQYNETDFAFVSRLLEEAGIYYFFEHAEDKHTMVLIDAIAKHKPRKADKPIVYDVKMQSKPTMIDWSHREEVRAVKAIVSDRDYIDPTTEIKADMAADAPPKSKVGKMEWYEHPAIPINNQAKDVKDSKSSDNIKQKATVLVQELNSLHDTVIGTTNTRDLGVGMTFELKDHPDDDENAKYLVVAGSYNIEFADHEAIEDLKHDHTPEGMRLDLLAI